VIDLIKLENVTKKYGDVLALDKLNLNIRDGEFYGFLGPNGAGKTTTIKIITGLLEADSGNVTVDGINIKDDPIEIKRRLGFIPDNPFLYEKLTAREYLRFIGKIYDLDDKFIEERSKYYLDLFNLTDWGNDLIESFSHGMRQKTAMAGALIHKPRVIIVDEPMVGLDPKGIILVKNIFSRLASEEKVTIFMSTHTLSIAGEICTRIGIIHKGKLIAEGTAGELQKEAKSKQRNLEDIFMILTDEVSSTELALKLV
jgi:ABC-2 type transport system ATP-binding protein